MSDYSTAAAPQNFNKSQAFAAALQRAKQIAAKINPVGSSTDGGTKRSLDDSSPESDSKKLATSSNSSVSSAIAQAQAVAARIQAQSLQNLAMGLQPQIQKGGCPQITEDIKVPDKMVGLIIGRGGEQITRLQVESGCKIQMAADSGGKPDRICTLTGNQAAILRAKELIGSIVNQKHKDVPLEMNSGAPSLFSGGNVGGASNSVFGGSGNFKDQSKMTNSGLSSNQQNNFAFIEIMLPGPKVGLVIGKGGEMIKQLQEKSGAKMVVIQEGPNLEAEKPLKITGDPQKVEHAKQLVYELLAEKETQPRRPNTNTFSNRGPNGQNSGPGRFNGQQESQYMVPAAKCGIIIGRGGETIKQINQSTGAHCELDRRPNNSGNPNEKIFIIRGTPEQIEAAKQMISEKLGQSGNHPMNNGLGMNMNPGAGGPYAGGAPQGGYQQPQQPWGGHYGGQPTQQYNQAQMDPSQMQQQMQAGQPNQGNQPDFSLEWIEYYRSTGMVQEAEAIEQQLKAKQAAAAVAATSAVTAGTPNGTGVNPQAAANTAVAAGNQAVAGQTPDFSLQWVQYYRSVGKIKEAEYVEMQIKAKASGQAQVSAGVSMPGGTAQPQTGGYPGVVGGSAPNPPGNPPTAAGGSGAGGQPSYYQQPWGAAPGYPATGAAAGGYGGWGASSGTNSSAAGGSNE